ncbi:DNase I-like protein [Glonium stellatum]|uniref:DNase I-like protein n=1 Tax=Glonium stellatum TaxID=574774 RepID=A0A8E2ENR4_9PEZI|nr:DNase I-like protein [Glonium stellatum]
MSRIMEQEITPPPTKRRRLSPPITVDSPTLALDIPRRNKGTIRIFAWNINGIAPFLQPSITKFFHRTRSSSVASSHSSSSLASAPSSQASLRGFLRRHQWPQILLLQEVKINPQDTRSQKAVLTAINTPCDSNDDGPAYTVHFTLPRDRHNARAFGGKVYGIASIMRRDFSDSAVETVREVDWDLEGRVHCIELRQQLAVFNVYAVNGTDNPYRSPVTGAVAGTRHDRKLAFHRLLVEECKRYEARGWKVVLAGDFNVARSVIDGWPNLRTYPEQHVRNRADFNAKFFEDEDGLRAVDVWRALKGRERRYTYFPRGRPWGSSCDRVDFAVVSRKLFDEGVVVDSGILDSAEERGPSDHVPLWVELKSEEIYENKPEERQNGRTN